MAKLSTRTKVSIARLLSRSLLALRRPLGLSEQTTVRRGGILWRLDLSEGIDLAIYLGMYERECLGALPELVRPGAVVIDVGANIGALSLPFARQAGPQGKIVAIEPTGFAFGKMTRTLQLNPDLADRVHPVQAMLLASTVGELPEEIHSSWPLHDRGGVPVHPTLRSVAMTTEGARVTTLDSLVAELSLSRVDLVKLDVDGHELQVLRGAEKTLAELRPRLIVELAPYTFENSPDDFAEMIRLLVAHGYAFRNLHDGRDLPATADEIVRAIPDGASINCLATATGGN